MWRVERELRRVPGSKSAWAAEFVRRGRARRWRSGWGRGVALLGVATGFLMAILPGVFALLSYQAWARGKTPRPLFAWILGYYMLAVVIVAPIWVALAG